MNAALATDQAETLAFANGEGVGEESCCATAALLEREAGRAAERADAIAWLERRKANALKVGESVPEFADEMRWIVRNIDVLLGDLANGMHEGAAGIAAALGEVGEA